MKFIATMPGRFRKLDCPAFIRSDASGMESPPVLSGASERTIAPRGT